MVKNVPKVNHKELMEIIGLSYEKRLPYFIWGTFGIGKSFMVKEFGKKYAKEKGLKFSDSIYETGKGIFSVGTIALHQFDPAELKGLPVPNHDTKQTEFYTTDMLPKDGQGIIFLDELNLAPTMVQNNAYQLILDRRLGNYVLPEGFFAMAAGNTIDDRAHIQEMAMPLKNRFGHVELMIPTAKEWVNNFAMKNEVDHRICNFLLFKEDYMHKYNPEATEEIIACPTPRTWEFTSKAIKGIENDSLMSTLAGAFVSTGIANEFVEWLKISRSYDIDEIYKTKKVEVPSDPSEIYALISAIISYYSKKVKPETSETLLDLAMLFKPEHAVITLNQAWSVSSKKFFTILKTQCPDKLKKAATRYNNLLF